MERRLDSIRRSRARKLVIGGVILLVIVAVSIPAVVLGQGASPPPLFQKDYPFPRPPVPDDPTAHLRLPTPPSAWVSEEVSRQARALLDSGVTNRVDFGNGQGIVAVADPATRGMTLQVAGKTLKLPDDAQLGGIVVEGLPAVGTPLKRPVMGGTIVLIERGDAQIFLSLTTGEFEVGRGTPEQYDFLIQALGRSRMLPR